MYRALQRLFLQRGQNVPHAFGYFIVDRHICVWKALMRFFIGRERNGGLGKEGFNPPFNGHQVMPCL